MIEKPPVRSVPDVKPTVDNPNDTLKVEGTPEEATPLHRPQVDAAQAILQLSDVANDLYHSREDGELLELGFDVIGAIRDQALALFRDTVAAETKPDYVDLLDFEGAVREKFAMPGSSGVFAVPGLDGQDYYYADNEEGQVSVWKIDPTSDIGTLLTSYHDAWEIMADRDAR